MWINLGFMLLMGVGIAFLLFSPRKEVPLLLFAHGLLQYVWTLSSWDLQLSAQMTPLLLGWLAATFGLLIWGRKLTYSRELFSIRLLFSVSQWAVLILMMLLISLRSPYVWEGDASLGIGYQPGLHPAIKLGGNLVAFTAFFHLILHWGQLWSLRKTLLDLGPPIVYFGTLLLLRYLQYAASVGVVAGI